MVCPNCNSDNVTIQLEQVEAVTSKKGNGLGGHINNAARAYTAVCTLGLSNLVWKKSKGGEKTKIKSKKVCICQDCGHSWYK